MHATSAIRASSTSIKPASAALVQLKVQAYYFACQKKGYTRLGEYRELHTIFIYLQGRNIKINTRNADGSVKSRTLDHLVVSLMQYNAPSNSPWAFGQTTGQGWMMRDLHQCLFVFKDGSREDYDTSCLNAALPLTLFDKKEYIFMKGVISNRI